jgi:hexosaminidase
LNANIYVQAITIPFPYEQMSGTTVTITANNFFGARHAFATLGQLVTTSTFAGKASMRTGLVIKDKPAYPFRSVMIDTARNFLPMKKMYSTVKAMGKNKLNTLHIHLSDTSSFPGSQLKYEMLFLPLLFYL